MSLTKEVMRFVMTAKDDLESDPHVGHLVREIEGKEPPPPSREQRVTLGPDTFLVIDKPTGKTILFDQKAKKPLYGRHGQENW